MYTEQNQAEHDNHSNYEQLLHDVALFLDELPKNFGSGRLNSQLLMWKVQLQKNIANTISIDK